jgi:hypothetical protein
VFVAVAEPTELAARIAEAVLAVASKPFLDIEAHSERVPGALCGETFLEVNSRR